MFIQNTSNKHPNLNASLHSNTDPKQSHLNTDPKQLHLNTDPEHPKV